jgi:AcrR family transcriptional regulator
MMEPARQLQPRKQPRQRRAAERVARILDAYKRLLEAGVPRITTNSVAARAAIPVSSIYQYFPNMEAIAFAVYRNWADEALAILRKRCADAKRVRNLAAMMSGPEVDFFADISGARIVHQLRPIIERSPELKQVQRKYFDQMVTLVMRMLRDLGSDWPERPLQNLVRLMLELNTSTFHHMARQDRTAAAETYRLWQMAARTWMAASVEPYRLPRE